MNKEIKYSGFTAVPSDYECADGELAAALNIIPEDGEMHPVMPPVAVSTLASGQSALFIHKTGDTREHYILLQSSTEDDGSLSYSIVCEDAELFALETGETVRDVNAIGDVLLVSTSLHLHFLRYKDGAYVYLGTELPKVNMTFALTAKLVSKKHTAKLTFSDISSAENSWTEYTYATFDTDLEGVETNGIGANASAVVSVSFTANLKKDTDYRIKATGTGFSYIVLYGIKTGSNKYTQVAPAFYSNSYKSFKLSDEYKSDSYKILIAGPTTFSGINKTISIPSTHTSGRISVEEGFTNTVDGKVVTYNEDNYNALMAAVNKFVNEQATQQNRFVHPFFVRYALRLADGSHARLSDPVLLVPNSGYAPFVNYKDGSADVGLYAFIAQLQYAFDSSIDERWRDFVSGVDVFASSPIYPYRQGDNFNAAENRFSYAIINKDKALDQITGSSYGYCNLPNALEGQEYGYGKHDLCSVAKAVLGFGDTTTQTDWRVVRVAAADDVMETARKTGAFYLIRSFEFDDVRPEYDIMDKRTFREIDMKDGVLASLVTREALSDDMLSNCTFSNARLTAYNQRMHLFDFSLMHAVPSKPSMLIGYTQDIDSNSIGTLCRVQVFIRTSKGNRVVERVVDTVNEKEYAVDIPWFYYPHNGAYQAVLAYMTASGTVVNTSTLVLKQHSVLNGAYWMADSFDDTVASNGQTSSYTPATADTVSLYPNSVLQSEASMPFVFPSSLMATLGVERIEAMAAAVKALSQGQFGQFPLYAFTSEGVWALEVSATGTYSAKQPVTRDVCSNWEAIAQLDTAVVYPTDRGLMLLSGSQTVCISDAIAAERPFNVLSLPGFSTLHTIMGHSSDSCLPALAFSKFLAQCRMLYDYVHQRLFVYAPSVSYAYVYSLRSQRWGMAVSSIRSSLNSYPEALAVNAANEIVNFSKDSDDEGATVSCLYATRPLKLDAPDFLKTIDSAIQRGVFAKGCVNTVLYGSRDLTHWHLVWSSRDHLLSGFRGSPYKFFRIAGVAVLKEGECLSGASVQFTARQTNKPR